MTFTLTVKQLEKLLIASINSFEEAMDEEMDVSTAICMAVDTTVDLLRGDNTTFPRPTSPARPCTACDGYSGNGAYPVTDGTGFVGSR